MVTVSPVGTSGLAGHEQKDSRKKGGKFSGSRSKTWHPGLGVGEGEGDGVGDGVGGGVPEGVGDGDAGSTIGPRPSGTHAQPLCPRLRPRRVQRRTLQCALLRLQ